MVKVKKKNLRTQWTNVYIVLAAFFVFGFLFFNTSKLFLADETEIINTEIGKEFSVEGAGNFMIKEWIYDENKNKMQITLVTSGLVSYLSDLTFKAVPRIDLTMELPTKIVYESNDIYIIQIDKVPKNFKQVAVRLVMNDYSLENIFNEELINESEKDKILTSIYTDERKIKRAKIEESTVKDYTIKITNEMIQETENKIKDEKTKIEEVNNLIKRIDDEIQRLKEELLYQTVEEQTQTNNAIYNLENDKEQYKIKIEELNNNIQSYTAKIERLEQRKKELIFN